MTYHKIVNETRATITQQIDRSDPTTCVGCLGYTVGSALCRELRQGDACQKRTDARLRLLAVVTELVNLAIVHHREQTIGPIIAQLLSSDGHTLEDGTR